MKKALVIIDIQNDTPKNYKEVIDNINKAIDWAVNNNIHIIYIRHENLSAGTRIFKPNTNGSELASDLKIVSKNVFTKYKGNALTSEEFVNFINNNKICEFYITGGDATICVKSTCFNLRKANYEVTVLSDCITSWSKKKIPEMIQYYESKGCKIISLNDLYLFIINKMNIEKKLYVTNREDWRKWLKNNFDKEKNVWLIYPKKSSGKERIIYNDAVEEALCFGWIDSTIKSLDKDNSIQRFSPRNPKSTYSQQNKERIKWLLEHDMIHPSILDKAKKIVSEKFVFPKDIINVVKKDKIAWKNYTKFSDSYKRIRVAYIESARKRPEEFQKRLSNFIKKTKDNKLIKGFGGIEKYY